MDLSGSLDFNPGSSNNGQVGAIDEFHVPESPVSEGPNTVDEYSIFVRVCTQILKLTDSVFQMDVRFNWTVGQVIQTLLARTDLPIAGIWELQFRHKTLSEEMTLAECGIDANNARFWPNDLVLVEHFWSIESLEEKQPIFRVKHQNPTLKNQELFLQYVCRSEGKHYPFKGTLFAYFQIVAQVAGGGEFFRFIPSKVPVSYDAAQLVPGLSEQQMWMADFGSKRQSAFSLPVGFIRDGYGDGLPPDRDILFIYFDNELFNPVEDRVVFMEAITGSNAVGNLRGMEREDFFQAGSPVHHDAYADPEENIKERLWAKGLPISGPDTTEGFLTLISDLLDPQDCLQRLTEAGFTQWEDLRGIKYEELIGEHVKLQPEQATKIRQYLTEIDVSPIVWSWEALNEWEAIFEANVEPQGSGRKPSEPFSIWVRVHVDVAVTVDPDATVRDLHFAARSAGVALKDRTLTFRGLKLTDPATLLVETGMSAEVVVDVAEVNLPGDIVEAVLEHLGILDCIGAISAEGYEFRDLPIAEPEDLVSIGLTPKQARILVFYFRPEHQAIEAEIGRSTRAEVNVSVLEKPGNIVEAVAFTFGGVGPESQLGVSDLLPSELAIYWNRDALNHLNPIFEAEIRIDSGTDRGVTKTLFVQWSPKSNDNLRFGMTRFDGGYSLPVELTVMCTWRTGKWMPHPNNRRPDLWHMCDVKEQNDVVRYLEKDHIHIVQDGLGSELSISVEMTEHVYKKHNELQIEDLSDAKLKGMFNPKYDPVEWSVTLKSVVQPKQSDLEAFMSSHQLVPFTLKQMLRKLGLLNFEQVLAEEGCNLKKLADMEPGELTKLGIPEKLGRKLIAYCRERIPRMMEISRDTAAASVGATSHIDPNVGVWNWKGKPSEPFSIWVREPEATARLTIDVAVTVDPEATVRDLHFATRSAGVDLKARTLTFRGQKLTDPATLLVDIEMSAEVVVGVSEVNVPEDTVKAVLEHLGILNCIGTLNAERYEFRDLPIAEPEDLVTIGLTPQQARILVWYFQLRPEADRAEIGRSTRAEVEVSASEKPEVGVGLLDCVGHKARYLPIADTEDLLGVELTSELEQFLYSGPKHPEVCPTHPEHPEWRLLADGGGTNEKMSK